MASGSSAVAGSSAHERFRAWASAQENFNISSIAWAEFLCGPLDVTAESIARQIFPNPEPMLSIDAALAAKVLAAAQKALDGAAALCIEDYNEGLLVVSGKLMLQIEGETGTVVVEPGQMYLALAGTSHAVLPGSHGGL